MDIGIGFLLIPVHIASSEGELDIKLHPLALQRVDETVITTSEWICHCTST